MPNSGVPRHMMMQPQASRLYVIYCHGAKMKVIPKKEWERAKSQGEPSLVLSRQEAKVLERFLRYWLQDTEDGLLCHESDVDAVFDY